MLSVVKALKVRQEVTIYRSGPIERRVRRAQSALYQVIDINWQHSRCWHVAYELSATVAWRRAQHSGCVFRSRNPFAPIVKGPRASGYQSKQNTLIKQRIFHDAKKRRVEPQRPTLIAIAGGKG